jgi:FkbM family methyltransferase
MNNGDDTAYYLSRGFRVVAIEAHPVLVEQTSRRFKREIATCDLIILNIGISDREGAFPFWICDAHPEWSSFDVSVASRDDVDHHQVTISCRRFRSVLEEFGTPYYLKLDIEGMEIYCLQDLIASDLPKYVSFEKTQQWAIESQSLTLLHNLGYTGFKLISQSSYLPLEYPPVREQRRYERTLKLLKGRNFGNFLLRVARKAGARRWLEPARYRPGWIFPGGSSGPFGEDTPGKWQSFEEIMETLARANSAWRAREPSVFWGDKSWSFWADIHARREV